MKDFISTIYEAIKSKNYKSLTLTILVLAALYSSYRGIDYWIMKRSTEAVMEISGDLAKYDEATKIKFFMKSENMAGINRVLDNMRNSVGAYNAFVFVDHNGITLGDNIHFKFTSCLFERQLHLNEYTYLYMRNLPLSMFANYYTLFEEQGFMYERDVEDIREKYGHTYYMFLAERVKSYLFIPMMSHSSFETQGWVGLTWTRTTDIPQSEIDRLTKEVWMIRGLLYNIKTGKRGG